ncbi:unnamed protein product [Macrosiphum euphorbiae]|uniref:Uncharacterized protein n=1 Tax=Macrosiphum euphorbiae TaxID=13131 RepID=A0AAV0X8H1_9HEMI|nr:unnamed protein product [Macrosiphum euphorbiae]
MGKKKNKEITRGCLSPYVDGGAITEFRCGAQTSPPTLKGSSRGWEWAQFDGRANKVPGGRVNSGNTGDSVCPRMQLTDPSYCPMKWMCGLSNEYKITNTQTLSIRAPFRANLKGREILVLPSCPKMTMYICYETPSIEF